MVRGLSDEEVKELLSVSSFKRSAPLKKLLKSLHKQIQNEEEYSKEKTFKDVFGESYKADKDYLLRNRLRDLNKIISDYMVEDQRQKNEQKKRNEEDLLLIESYVRRTMFDRFDAEFDEMLEKFETSMDYVAGMKLIEHYFDRRFKQRMILPSEKEELGAKARKYLSWAQKVATRNIRFSERMIVYAEYAGMPREDRDKNYRYTPIQKIDLSDIIKDDLISEYKDLELQELLPDTRGRRMEILEEMNAVLSEIVKFDDSYNRRFRHNLFQMAIIQAENQDWENALKTLNQHEEEMIKAGKVPNLNEVHFNALLLIILDKFDELESQLNKYKHLVQDKEGKCILAIDFAYGKLFQNDPAGARAYLNEAEGESELVKLSLRVSEFLCLFEEGEYEVADYELNNITRLINKRNKNGQLHYAKAAVTMLGRLMKARMKPPGEREKAIEKLHQETTEMIENKTASFTEVLTVKWVDFQLGKLKG